MELMTLEQAYLLYDLLGMTTKKIRVLKYDKELDKHPNIIELVEIEKEN